MNPSSISSNTTNSKNAIIKQIISETNDYRYLPIMIVPNMLFNQWDLINTIYFYWNSRFQSGATDDEGDKKYFINKVINPCFYHEKGISFDVKDIKFLTAGGGDPLKTWFMERDFQYWARDKNFDKILDRIFHELPIFGTVVIKIVNSQPYFVDLRNFLVDKSADTLDEMNYIVEQHNMSVSEFRKKGKVMKWSQAKIDEVIKKYHEGKYASIRIFERYGDVETKPNIFTYQRTFIADVGTDKFLNTNTGQVQVSERGILLSSEDWDEHPYWEFHMNKFPGRWLGNGIVERLMEPQIRHNEIANLQAKASYWAALRVFQTRDGAINRNLSTDVTNGQIMNVDSEITQIDMSDRNLAFFNEETSKWDKVIADLTFAFSPIGHSKIAIQVAMEQVSTYFASIQKGIATTVKQMIYEDIMPQFENDMTVEHAIRLVGQDLDEFAEMNKNKMVFQEVLRLAVTQGKQCSNQDADVIGVAMTQMIKQNKEHLLTVIKGYYKGVKYDIDINIKGYSKDTDTQMKIKFAVLQAITTDPTLTQDPVKKKILASYMEDGGLNPNDIFSVEQKDPQQISNQGRAGGGVSSPIASPMSSQSMTTV